MSQAQALKERVARYVDRELARCRVAMGAVAWEEHCAWVEDNVVESAREWLNRAASEGRL